MRVLHRGAIWLFFSSLTFPEVGSIERINHQIVYISLNHAMLELSKFVSFSTSKFLHC